MNDDLPSPRGEWIAPLVARHEEALVRYASRLLGDVDRARDVVQETFLRLCREAEPEKLDGHMTAWLFTVCRHQALDSLRKEQRMTPMSALGELTPLDRQPPQHAALENRETVDRILQLLETLPENQQEVVRLKFQNGFTYRQISEITQLTVTNVGYLLHTALHKLRVELAGPGANIHISENRS